MDSARDARHGEITGVEFDDLKKADRAELQSLPPCEAQAAVEQLLHPRLWRVEDPEQLAWPGDLAEEDD